MLDTIKIGLLRLDTQKEAPGYVRVVTKTDPDGPGISYFRIPLHVVFDLEGYNSYKEFLQKENTEMKTWIQDISLNIPPTPENIVNYPNSGHEWFLGTLRDMSNKVTHFPASLKKHIDNAIEECLRAKRSPPPPRQEEDDYDPPPMSKAEQVAACHSVILYNMLQRSRFELSKQNQPNKFQLRPFVRTKGDKSAKEVIQEVTEVVAQYVWQDPKVSKYSETEGFGLKIKLSGLFLEIFYKEQIRFMQAKLEVTKNKEAVGQMDDR